MSGSWIGSVTHQPDISLGTGGPLPHGLVVEGVNFREFLHEGRYSSDLGITVRRAPCRHSGHFDAMLDYPEQLPKRYVPGMLGQ